MGARKSVKKAPAAKKAAGGRKKTAAKKKAAAKRAPAKKAATKKAAAKQVARKKPATPEPKISSLGVNMGHVLALRPRLRPSFRPEDFKSAKLFLQDETYQSIEQAARAVAEKALELTHEGPPRHGFMRRR